jgi:hypothetical protein
MLELSSCITDVIIRVATVGSLEGGGVSVEQYSQLRQDIIRCCINYLDEHRGDAYKTEQLFTILSGITRKCYQMIDPKEFFDELIMPFNFMPITQFAFSGGENTVQGTEFLKTLIYNMYNSSPDEALQDLMEINFGFQPAQAHISQDKEEEKSSSPEKTNKEGSTLKQVEAAKEAILSGQNRIYSKLDVNDLFV